MAVVNSLAFKMNKYYFCHNLHTPLETFSLWLPDAYIITGKMMYEMTPGNCHFIHHLTCYYHWLYSHKLLPLGVVKYGINNRIND